MKFLWFGLIALLSATISMGQPDTNSPGTATSASPGSIAWTTPNNIMASDNSYASATNGTSETITASNFGFNLPTNAVVDGIEVDVERYGRASNNIAQGTWTYREQPLYAGTDVYNTLTYSNVPVTAGSNRLLLVTVAIENVDNTDTIDIALDAVTVTYNGVSMTQIANPSEASGTTRNWLGMYYLLDANLPAGASTADLVVTKNRGASATVDDPEEYIEMVGINTFTNVNQTFPFTAVNTSASGNANSITAGSALDVTQGDMLVTAVTGNSSGSPWTSTGASYTVNINQCENNGVTTGACFSVGTRSITTTGVADVTPTAATGGGNHARRALIGIVLQGARVFDNGVQLEKGGTPTGSDFGLGNATINVSWPEVDATTTYGGPTDLWGTTWNYSEINNTNFGIALSADAANATAFIDHISITVYYTLTLPIDLIGFEAKYVERKVRCKATVYIDDANDYTVITERSADGITFSKVNEKHFNLGQPSMHTFEVNDLEPYTGLSYYRLKLIDHFAEDSKYSKAKAVFVGEGAIVDWKLYPNPAKNTLIVEIPNYDGQTIVFNVYDAIGRNIPLHAQEQANGRFVISPLEDWKNGVYIIDTQHQQKHFKGRFVVRK